MRSIYTDSKHPLFNQNRHWKATLRYRWLQFMGITTTTLVQRLSGKTIAVVGNAESLFGRTLGAAIDAHEVVIRLNYGSVSDQASQGSRTDILAVTAKVPEATILNSFCPGALIWLSPFAKVPGYSQDIVRRTHFLGRRRWYSSYESLDRAARPSSGYILLWWLKSSVEFESLGIFGFDFGASPSFYTGKNAKDVHDFDVERRKIASMVATNVKLY